MEQATYKQLQDTVYSSLKKMERMEADYNKSQEALEYWQNIATQQNDCILSQRKRHDDLRVSYDELKTQTPKDTSVEVTELKAVIQGLETKNKELDKMLETYEDSYKVQKAKLDKSETMLKGAKLTIEKMGHNIVKSEALERSLLATIVKFKGERKEIISSLPQRPTPPKRINDITQRVTSVTKTVTVNFDTQGNYYIEK